jgi:hypothetical protein
MPEPTFAEAISDVIQNDRLAAEMQAESDAEP